MTEQTTIVQLDSGASPETASARPGGLSVTAGAARRIAELVAAEASEPRSTMLRVNVSGGGCSGFQYGFELAAQTGADDTVFERDGAKVVVDSCSLELLAGCEIDWAETLAGASFQISNPNATSSCGCGASFSI